MTVSHSQTHAHHKKVRKNIKVKNAHHTIYTMQFTMTMATMDTEDRLCMDLQKHTVVHFDAEATTLGEAFHDRNIDRTFNNETVAARAGDE